MITKRLSPQAAGFFRNFLNNLQNIDFLSFTIWNLEDCSAKTGIRFGIGKVFQTKFLSMK